MMMVLTVTCCLWIFLMIPCSAFLLRRSSANQISFSRWRLRFHCPTCTTTTKSRLPPSGVRSPEGGEVVGSDDDYQDRTAFSSYAVSSPRLRACGLYRSIGESVWKKMLATNWLEPCAIPDSLLSNQAPTKGMKGWTTRIETRALTAIGTKDRGWPRQSSHPNPISYARLALIETIPLPGNPDAAGTGGDMSSRLNSTTSVHTKGVQVLNVVILPRQTSCFPIWGADFVSLPSDKHLLLLDAQPVDAGVRVGQISEFDAYWSEWYRENDIASHFPWGGDLPDPVKPFVSSNALWTRFSSSGADSGGGRKDLIQDHLQQVVETHLDIYLGRLADFSSSNSTMNLQSDYIRYRRENDPASPMLKALYGEEWTESFLSKVMFPQNV
jgi:Ferredoxin-dependent bilin reductase